MGFLPAAAIFIAASQIPAALGAVPPLGGVLENAAWTLGHPGDWDPAAVGLAALVGVAVVGGRRLHALFPGVLVAVVVAVLLSELGGYGGDTVGDIPVGVPPISLDLPWGSAPELVVGALVIALIGFAEPASIARQFAAQDRILWDADREFVSQGVANLASGVSGGFPIGGSFTRSALNRSAGARTAWSGAVTGVAVLALLPLAFLLAPLPTAVLSAIVVGAVVPLIRLRPIARLWRHSRPAFLIAVGTLASTLALAPRIERGVLVGVGLSIAVHLWRELHIEIAAWLEDGVLHIAPRGVLWFGAAERVEDAFLRELAAHPEAEHLHLHLDGVGRLDITAALILHDILDQAKAAGLTVAVSGAREQDRRLVDGVVVGAPR
jgi:sulfate permease, SulP family